MRIVIPGGSGQVGAVLARSFLADGHEVQVLGRSAADPALRWDGRSEGPWWQVIDGADAVIQLTGRSVNCRYHWPNLNQMWQSRVDSVEAVGRAIAAAARPPKVWLQASTASIYADTRGAPHTERDGVLGGREPGVPPYWAYSVTIARSWELALQAAPTPHTRKVAMRLGFTMSPDPGGIFDWLVWLARIGFGGRFGPGDQFVSWISDVDVVRAIRFLIDRDDLAGPVNLTSPAPLPQAALMAQLCDALGVRVRLPIARWMAEVGAVPLRTDTELLLKSRRVAPERLLAAGFTFELPTWDVACPSLVGRWGEPTGSRVVRP